MIKYAFFGLFVILAFVIMMNVSIMIFNLFDAWLGIGVGTVTVFSFLYLLIWFTKQSHRADK